MDGLALIEKGTHPFNSDCSTCASKFNAVIYFGSENCASDARRWTGFRFCIWFFLHFLLEFYAALIAWIPLAVCFDLGCV